MQRLVLAVMLGLMPHVACSNETAPDRCKDEPAAKVVDQELLSFLSKARSAHHTADVLEGQSKLEQAVAALRRLVDGPNTPDRIEASEVLADTHARLAELTGKLKRYDEAEKHIQQGLALATGATYFRGHLFEVKGLVLEAQGKALRAKGEDEPAKRLEEQAISALQESMRIQEQVLDSSLEGGR